jgi:hypothetical protein
MVMAVRSLQALILILVGLAGFEIGYLRRPLPPETRVVFTETAPVALTPCSAPAPPAVEPDAVAATEPRPAPRRPRHRRDTTGPIPGGGSVADCAQNGGPLCGMPE